MSASSLLVVLNALRLTRHSAGFPSAEGVAAEPRTA